MLKASQRQSGFPKMHNLVNGKMVVKDSQVNVLVLVEERI